MARGSKRLRGQSWELRVYAGDGHYVTQTLPPIKGKPRTARDADAELRKMLDEVEQSAPAGSATTIRQLLARYVEVKSPRWSVGTLKEHRSIIAAHLNPLLGDYTLAELSRQPELIDLAWAQARRGHGDREPISEARLLRIHVVLHAAVQMAVRWRWIAANPVDWATRPSPEERKPESPPQPEVRRALEVIAKHDPMIHAFLRLAANTGARRGEICALRWAAIDLVDGEVLIARAIAIGEGAVADQQTKTRSTRRIALGPVTVAALKAWRAKCAADALAFGVALPPDGYVFSPEPDGSDPWLPSSVTRRWRLLRARHKLPAVTIKDLRHFVATELLDSGQSVKTVQERVGHDRASTTLDIYSAALPARDHDAAQFLDELIDRADDEQTG